MKKFDKLIRQIVPSTAVLSKKKFIMGTLEIFDRLTSLPFREFRYLPPNRLRIRVGVGNRLLFNQPHYLSIGVNFWINAFASGLIQLDSNITDIGSGCGRFASILRNYSFYDSKFVGKYIGIDVDKEMIDWCQKYLASNEFTFKLVDAYNKVYNPNGKINKCELPIIDDSQDLVIATSLFTHLLEDDFLNYLSEIHRILKKNGCAQFSIFCLDHLKNVIGNRYTFKYKKGNAYLESLKFPEAAVAYEENYIINLCNKIGFQKIEIMPSEHQSLLRIRK